MVASRKGQRERVKSGSERDGRKKREFYVYGDFVRVYELCNVKLFIAIFQKDCKMMSEMMMK